MAFRAEITHYYKPNQIEFLSGYSDAGNYPTAYNDLMTEIQNIGSVSSQIRSLSIIRLRPLQDGTLVSSKLTYAITVIFDRVEGE